MREVWDWGRCEGGGGVCLGEVCAWGKCVPGGGVCLGQV